MEIADIAVIARHRRHRGKSPVFSADDGDVGDHAR